MVMAVAPGDVAQVEAVCARYNVEVTDLGAFEASGRLTVYYGAEVAGDLDMAFLHDGWPERKLQATWAPGPGDDRLPPPPADEGA
jgi:phosphoribosylformylglycinamidine synthase